jgi:hypothetical protein
MKLLDKIKKIIKKIIAFFCGEKPQYGPTYIRDEEFNNEPTSFPPGFYQVVRHLGPKGEGFNGGEIDTRRSPFRNVIGGGPHHIITYVFSDNMKDYSIELDYTVAGFETNNGGVSQYSVVYYAKKDDRIIGVVLNLYDNRGNNYEPFWANDTYTDFYSSPTTVDKIRFPFEGYKLLSVSLLHEVSNHNNPEIWTRSNIKLNKFIVNEVKA